MFELPSGTFNTTYAQDMMLVRTGARKILLILFVCFMYLCPTVIGSRYLVQVLTGFIVWILAAQGLNILTGLCGQISLGHAAFVGVGAYTTAILSTRVGFPFWLAVPSAGLMAAFIGVLFGLPSVRVKGFYLALSTMGAQFILLYAFLHWNSLTGGADGMQVAAPELGIFLLDNPHRFFPFALTVCIMMTFFFISIKRSKIGRAFIAIKENDVAAEGLGINIFRYKTVGFGIGCFYAGVAGCIMAYNLRFVSIDYFPFMDSLWYVGVIIIGGMGTIIGPVLGVIFVKGISEILTLYVAPVIGKVFPALGLQISASISVIFFAVIIMVFVVFEPRGLAYRWNIVKNYFRLWPFPY